MRYRKLKDGQEIKEFEDVQAEIVEILKLHKFDLGNAALLDLVIWAYQDEAELSKERLLEDISVLWDVRELGVINGEI